MNKKIFIHFFKYTEMSVFMCVNLTYFRLIILNIRKINAIPNV